MIAEYPYIWQNIKFKFKDYTNILKTNASAEDKKIAHDILLDEIIKIFMKPSEHNPFLTKEKKEIRETICAEIIDNDTLVDYISGHSIHSFIEYSNSKLKNLSERKAWGGFGVLVKNISDRNLIQGESGARGFGLIKDVVHYAKNRVFNSNEAGIRSFNSIFKEIIDYANRIFHIDIYKSLPNLKSVEKFSDFDMVGTMLKNAVASGWAPCRDATFFIKALYAWNDILEIKVAHKEALEAPSDFFAFINDGKGKCKEITPWQSKITKKLWIWKKRESIIHRRYVYSHTFEDGTTKDIYISTRVKSVESILIKLFADEHYGDIDALNDLFGVRMFLGWLTEGEKIQVIHHFGKFMGKNSAIFKNKNYLSETQMSVLKGKWRKSNSMPIWIESRLKTRNSKEYRDCKYSGYLRQDIHKNQIGTEIQFFNTEDDPNPKGAAHHSILDAKKIIQWWYRGAHIITGKQIAGVIQARCFKEDNSWLEFEEVYQEINKTLVPYVLPKKEMNKNTEIAFAVRWYERILEEEFPSMKPLPQEYFHLLDLYIKDLKKEYDVCLPHKK